MKKNILLLVYMLILWLTWVQNFVYAEEECEACNTTSPYIDNYINFWYEIIQTFQTYANSEQSVFQKSWQNLITNGSSQNTTESDLQRELQSIVDNLNNKAQSVASAGYVFSLITIEWAFLDSWKNVGPLMNNQSIMRDWQKIDNLDQSITNTLIDLWNAWVFVRLWFRNWWRDRINQIVQKYTSMQNAPIQTSSLNSTQPTDILWWLRRMNQALKSSLSIWWNKELWNSFMDWAMKFSSNAIDNMPLYYACAKWVGGMATCSPTGNRAKNNLESTWENTKDETSGAVTMIKNAVKRLSWFRSSNGQTQEMFKQRQNDLLRWQYWRQWVRNNEWEPLVQGFWDAWKTVKNNISSVWPFAGRKENSDEKTATPFVVWDITTTIQTANQKQKILLAFAETTNAAEQNRNQSVLADISPITKLFPLITQEIITAQYRIDSTKPNAITQSLWEACETQCKNLWWTCWYQ